MSDYYVSWAEVESHLRSRNYCLDTDADIEYVVERFRAEIPPVDVRPVVFCKDCIHFTAFSVINTDGIGKCGLRGKCSIDCLVDEYDFCSSGERSDEVLTG